MTGPNPPTKPTTPVVYGHPFSSYCQKVFMAFYEKDAPFELRVLSGDDPAALDEWRDAWPLERMPVLRDGATTLVETSIIIEWLCQRAPGAPALIPADPDAALEVRMLDRIFDGYVMNQMQTFFFNARRPEATRDPHGVADARAMLDRVYGWLDRHLVSRHWAAGDDFTLADCAAAPALFYASWVHPFDAHAALSAYYRRLLARPSFARCIEDGRPHRGIAPIAPPEDCP